MTDADRLREAAGSLPLRHTIDCTMTPGSMWHPCSCGAREQRDAQAALLRAVADDPNSPHTPSITDAALALADAILGGEA